jgi:hypothetical protein
VLQRNRTARSVDGGDALLAGCQHASDVGDPDGVTGVQALVGGWVDERQRQHPKIDEVLPVDARETLRDHDLCAEIGALTIVRPADDGMAIAAVAMLRRALRVGVLVAQVTQTQAVRVAPGIDAASK